MEAITVLIALVSSLLLQVQQPNVPVQIRAESLQVASQVLQYAQTQVASSTGATSTFEVIASSTLPTGTLPVFVTPTGGVVDSNGNAVTVPVQPVLTPSTSDQVALPTAPICTFSAQVVPWHTSWRAQFAWSFTDGAKATITSNGSLVPIKYWSGNEGRIVLNDSTHQSAVYGTAISQNTNYELTVQMNGQSATCTAQTVVPGTPPPMN